MTREWTRMDRDHLEMMLDHYGLSELLEMLSTVCSHKADSHEKKNQQLSFLWGQDSLRLEKWSRTVNN
jgi:hypothetical protein